MPNGFAVVIEDLHPIASFESSQQGRKIIRNWADTSPIPVDQPRTMTVGGRDDAHVAGPEITVQECRRTAKLSHQSSTVCGSIAACDEPVQEIFTPVGQP